MFFLKPRADLKPNTLEFERIPLVKPTGFREYDARWLFPEEINLLGLNAVGLGMAKLFEARGVPKRLVVGHDYRSYSGAVKQALITGLLAGGCEVHDIGLALSPTRDGLGMPCFWIAIEVQVTAVIGANLHAPRHPQPENPYRLQIASATSYCWSLGIR